MLDRSECGKVYFEVRQADFAILAQLIEHSIRNRKVVGLNPMDGSNIFNNLARLNRSGFCLFPRKFPNAVITM